MTHHNSMFLMIKLPGVRVTGLRRGLYLKDNPPV
jgi:hypothetical protein